MTAIEEMARRIADADQFGALHVVVADGNMEDSHLDFCLSLPEITETEREFVAQLRRMDIEDRYEAWEVSVGR